MRAANDTSLPAAWLADLRDWCKERLWYARVPIWLYLAYVGFQQFQEPESYNSLFAGINLCIHEGGHILFRPFGELIHVAGGTLAQFGAPAISIVILYKQRDYFGVTFCLGWLSTNLIGVGVYMADARDMVLPLVTAEGDGSDDQVVQHDWNYLFGHFCLLDHDKTIGLFTRGLGSATMLLALLSGAWVIWEIFRANRPVATQPP